MPFELRQLSWHKRRRATEAPKPVSFKVDDFKKQANHFCRVHVTFENGVDAQLQGRVSQNPVNLTWSVNAINAHGQAVFLKWVDDDT